jgi:ParB family chromosome partitioning protein
MAGLKAVPAIINQATQQQMLEWALVENIHRSDLNPIERANAYRQYMDRFNLTQQELAERLGQPRASVANYLRLLDLCGDVCRMVSTGRLTFGHAKVLAGLVGAPEVQLQLANKAADGGLSVRELEVLVAKAQQGAGLAGAEAAPRTLAKPAYIVDLQQRLSAAVGSRVTIQPGRGKNSGRVIIEYYSLDDFDRLSARLGVAPEGQ